MNKKSRIIAYTYLAAVHCPDCTRRALRAYRQQITRPYAGPAVYDEYGLPDDMVDREGNPVRPVFPTDVDIGPAEACDDRGRRIVTAGFSEARNMGEG